MYDKLKKAVFFIMHALRQVSLCLRVHDWGMQYIVAGTSRFGYLLQTRAVAALLLRFRKQPVACPWWGCFIYS